MDWGKRKSTRISEKWANSLILRLKSRGFGRENYNLSSSFWTHEESTTVRLCGSDHRNRAHSFVPARKPRERCRRGIDPGDGGNGLLCLMGQWTGIVGCADRCDGP